MEKPKRDYLSSVEKKTTGTTILIGCVVKTKEGIPEQHRKEDNWVNITDRMCGKTKEILPEQRRKEDNWDNLHDRMCDKNQRETI